MLLQREVARYGNMTFLACNWRITFEGHKNVKFEERVKKPIEDSFFSVNELKALFHGIK